VAQAEGSDITQLPERSYANNDKQYFIELPPNGKPVNCNTAKNTRVVTARKATGTVGTVNLSDCL
jgi:hypothetical protein